MIVPGRISEATRLELGLHQVPHDANLIDLLRIKVRTLLLDKNIQLDKRPKYVVTIYNTTAGARNASHEIPSSRF